MAAASGKSTKNKGSLLYDPKFRSIVSQVLLISLIVIGGYWIYKNTITNLDRLDIETGFRFLNETAGFGINQTLIEYSETSSYGRVFWVGLLNTIVLASVGILLATIIGFFAGVMRLSKNWVVSSLAALYVEVVRNIPLLLQIFFWYFAVLRQLPGPRDSVNFFDAVFLNTRGVYMPSPIFAEAAIWSLMALIAVIIGIFFLRRWARLRQMATGQQFPVLLTSLAALILLPGLVFVLSGSPVSFSWPELKGFNFQGGSRVVPSYVAMLLALSIYTGSYIAEVVRAGILAVSHGQTEAAHSLGLSNGQALRLVVVPQAMRVIIPPLTNQYLNLTKNSSLAVAIAYPDLVSVFGGTALNQIGQAIEVLFMVLCVYLGLSLLISMFMNWYNSRLALVER